MKETKGFKWCLQKCIYTELDNTKTHQHVPYHRSVAIAAAAATRAAHPVKVSLSYILYRTGLDSETKPEKASGLGNRPFAKSASLCVEAPGGAVALQKAQKEPLGYELTGHTVVLESGNDEEDRLQGMGYELSKDDQ